MFSSIGTPHCGVWSGCVYMRDSWHVSADDCGVGVVCVGSAGVGAVGAVNKPLSGFSAMSDLRKLKKNTFTQ